MTTTQVDREGELEALHEEEATECITGLCESESCEEPATCYDVMGNKLCDEHWEQARQEELEDE
jgi:hypothetical protein